MDTVAVRVIQFTSGEDGGEVVAIAQPMTLKTVSEDELCIEMPETMRLRPDEAQQFMDELWRIGIRPTNGTGSTGQIEAMQRHLDDMRTLVFRDATAAAASPANDTP